MNFKVLSSLPTTEGLFGKSMSTLKKRVHIILPAKILLLGDGFVGKTSLRSRYMGGQFNSNYSLTIGADFAHKEIYFQIEDKNYMIRSQIWDLAGQTTFKQVRLLYYRGGNALIIVYDITNRESFDNIPSWVQEAGKILELDKIAIILLGNKVDLRKRGKHNISTRDGKKLAKKLSKSIYGTKNGIYFYETSASTGTNIEEAFIALAKRILSLGEDISN